LAPSLDPILPEKAPVRLPSPGIMEPTIHINASGGTDFYQQIATFAYGSYVLHGSGAVIVTEGELPDEVIEQINDYDPELQCVFAMIDSEAKASVLTLNAAEHMGSTPKMLFEEAIKRQQHVPILPGIVVRLKDCVGDIEPGWFVFLGEEKSDMILSRAGEDEDGDVVRNLSMKVRHFSLRLSCDLRRLVDVCCCWDDRWL